MNLDEALREFDRVDANLTKLERTWSKMAEVIRRAGTVAFGSPEEREYDQLRRDFKDFVGSLPAIEGWRVSPKSESLAEIVRQRMDVGDTGDGRAVASWEETFYSPGAEVDEYRSQFTKKRRQLVRSRLGELVTQVDRVLRGLKLKVGDLRDSSSVEGPEWEELRKCVDEVNRLLGDTPRNPDWTNLFRHLSFAQACDLQDIEAVDWPAVRIGIGERAIDESEPLAVGISDLGAVVATRPGGAASTALDWKALNAEDFERLMFSILSEAEGYENPAWLMNTMAADRGRDLSVFRVVRDSLAGVGRKRVIVQCKHWLTRSVADADVADTVAKMKHWEPPTVDVLVVATSGRFTADAVKWIEQHNEGGKSPSVEMWPESHLERLLAQRPHLAAASRLR